MKRRKPLKGLITFRHRRPGRDRQYAFGDACRCRKGVITNKTDSRGRTWLVCPSCGGSYGLDPHVKHPTRRADGTA